MRLNKFGTIIILAIIACAANGNAMEITHGPILGRLDSNGIGVWGRTSRPVGLRVRYGLAQDALDLVSESVATAMERDNTGWVHLKGLKSNTKYFYRLETVSGFIGQGGSFRTLPTTEDMRHPEHNPRGLFNFSFEFACGNKPNPDPGSDVQRPTFVTMLRELDDKIDFAILDGDWIYERKRDYTVEQWLDQVGATSADTPDIVRMAPSIVGVWENYKDYLATDPNLAAWHREIPSFFVFDDHEILNDINGTAEIGYRDFKAVFRDIGTKAWYDYLGWSQPPSFTQDIHFGMARLQADNDVLYDAQANFEALDLEQAASLTVHWGGQYAGTPDGARRGQGGDPNACVYEIVEILDKHRLRMRPAAKSDTTSAYSIGRRSYTEKRISNCHIFFIDTRSHRGLHDVKDPFKAGLSMIGVQQRTWLMEKMRNSDADFLFVVSSVNFMIPHVAPNAKPDSNKDEAWTTFLEEREQLIEFWDGLQKPVMILTGDLHNSFAIKITDRVWEFASGPHSSINHRVGSEGGRPANGPFQYGPRPCEIRWSSYVLPDLSRSDAKMPHYCVVQVNNVFRNPDRDGKERWVAYPRPHVLVQYYDGLTGALCYAEPIFADNLKKEAEE